MIDLVPATRRTADLIANIEDEQLASPTPCPNYTLGDLLDHLNGLCQAFTDAATKRLPEGGTQAPSGNVAHLERDWRTRIPQRLAALAEAWRDPAAWEGMTQAGDVDMPGDIAGLVALDEVIVHGWDIAKASGQPYDAEPDHIHACIQTMAPQPGEERPVGDACLRAPRRRSRRRPAHRPSRRRPGRDPSWTPR